jgi:hypothetical protein
VTGCKEKWELQILNEDAIASKIFTRNGIYTIRVVLTFWNSSKDQDTGNADYNRSVNINNDIPMLTFIHFNEFTMEPTEEEMVLITGVPDLAGESVVPWGFGVVAGAVIDKTDLLECTELALDDLATDILATVVFGNGKVVLLDNSEEVVSNTGKLVVLTDDGAVAVGLLAGTVLVTRPEVLPDATVSEASVFAGAAGFRAERST